MGAKLYDLESLISAGFDPKTGLPLRMTSTAPNALKENIRKQLRILDEQAAVNRFRWFNLPSGLTGQLIERILYYRGQAMFFYLEGLDKFYFLPYALDGDIDVYGRYLGVTPLPFNGTSDLGADKKPKRWIEKLTLEPIYEMIDLEELKPDDFKKKCVILNDYSKQIAQNIIPRQILQDPLLDVMSDCIPFMRTALLNSTGVEGMRVNSQDEYANVEACSRAIDAAALNGKKYVPVVGNVEFQDLTGGNVSKTEEFMMAMQSLDNFRLSLYGLDNGGLFQKKAHMLQDEQDMNAGTIGLVYQDGLTLRQEFCDLVNSLFGLGISCEPSETVTGNDMNMDGLVGDDQDQSGLMEGTQDVEVLNE